MTKQIVVIGTAVMTTLLALVALWQFRIVVIYVLISLALAATVRPMARSESRRNVTTRLLMILLYVVSIGVFGLLIFLVGRVLIGDLQELGQTISEESTWVLPSWAEGSLLIQALGRWLPTPDKLFEAIASQRQLILSAVLGFTQGIGGIVSAFFVILFLSIYWSINQNHFERLWLSLLASEQRTHARDIWRTLEYDLGAYIRSEIIQSILAVLLLGTGYWLLGSPYPALLAVVGAIAWLVPVVGVVLAVILPLLLGLLTGAQLSLFTVLYTLIVLIALQVWLEPRLFRRKWNNPILTLILLLALADAFGLLGVILAPPLSVVCQILWSLSVSNRLAPATAVQLSDLKERQAGLRLAIEEMKEPPPPLVLSSMERLAALLEKADPLLQSALPPESPKLLNPFPPLPSENVASKTQTPE
ncbi:MAG TPA: AI-2E family transporter [Anaerolineales bacterium]|jgi:predicted PurR-regulated permease PerM|nr:AI-2E family transporter [Anaerolineales bacterium]